MRDTGGGFGQKVMVQREEMAVMLAAMKLPNPLKWVEDRRENLMAAKQSRHEHGHIRMAFDQRSVIQGVHIDYVEDDGAYPTPWPVMVTSSVGGLFPGPYRVPKASFTTKTMYTNTPGRSAYRGPWVFESVAREMLLDKAARQMGIDPIELRRRNLLAAQDMPYTNPNGMAFDHITPLENFERAVERLGYEAFRARQGEARQEGRYLGVGTCTDPASGSLNP
jgi:carbon-monoxide dehydrogenase large subunit